MVRKKSSKTSSKTKVTEESNARKKLKKSSESETNNNEEIQELAEESNGVRRSGRTRVSRGDTQTKSKYFDDSDDDQQVMDNDDSDYRSDVEVKTKPTIKRKAKPKPKPKVIEKPTKVKSKQSGSALNEDSDSDDSEDWEEVKGKEVSDLDDYNPDIPAEGVEITVSETVTKTKKKWDVNDWIRQRINRCRCDLQSDRHKVSLLMLIAKLKYINNSLNDELIKAIALSITGNQFKAPKRLTNKFLNEFIDWFKHNFTLKLLNSESNESIDKTLRRCLEERTARNGNEMNLIFISLLKSLRQKYNIRLCYALNPVDIKAVGLIPSERQRELQRRSSTETKSKVKGKEAPKTQKKSKAKRSKPEEPDNCDTNDSLDTTARLELWVEVYVESENKWISLDLSNDLMDKPMKIALKSLPFISYVIGLDSDGYIREVTQRYTDEWMSVAMKKRRTDQEWWTQTLKLFGRQKTSSAERYEDIEFEEKLAATPLPIRVSDYKNHPLYVLAKDLLKFQGLYSIETGADIPPVGFFRGDPVYRRDCVQLLRSKEAWLREARTVKPDETPYKCVTSRPKWDKIAKVWRKDLPLDLYGEWQTGPYEPPEAKDGKVPRNSFGNVDLYQPSMLPKGCVQIQLPGLMRIANKLNIDCVPAIVGFDNTSGQGLACPHPVMGGFVVCKQFKQILIDAWDEEQEIARKKDIEKKEKRVYDNWKKLIKGLMIKEKLKRKYKTNADREEDSDETEIESDY